MTGLVVTGHGHFASGLKEALNVIAYIPEHVAFVDFELNDSQDDLERKLSEAYDRLEKYGQVLTLADLTGGSPFKSAATLGYLKGDRYQTVGGCNLGMLLEMIPMSRQDFSAEELAQQAMEVGRQSIAWFTYRKKQFSR